MVAGEQDALEHLIAQFVRDQAWAALTAIVSVPYLECVAPALEGAQADADLTAGVEQARIRGMGLVDQLDRLAPVRDTSQFLLAPQLRLEGLDLPLALSAELLQLHLLFYGQNRLLIGILRSLPPTVHLLRVKAFLAAIGAQPGGIEPSGFEHNRELFSSAPTLGVLLRCRHHLPLQSLGHPPLVEGHHVDAQFF